MNLFWKSHKGTTPLISTPFKSEEEFESTVFDTTELLEDIFLIKRQVRGGDKTGIPDIIGVDNDGNVCIIEMKNTTVDVSVVPQVLQYAFWAETNPDSIKSLWLECEDKPEELSISWDDFEVRILVIAPSILRTTLDLVDKINYQVDLIEIRRWIEGSNELLLVNKLEQEEKRTKPRPVAGLPTYDEEFYKNQYNRKSAEAFLKYVREVENFVQAKQWPLVTKFNKHYCGFKAGFFNVFGVKWMGSKTFAFFFKIGEDEAPQFDSFVTRYEAQWKEAYCYIEPGKTKTKDFAELFEYTFKKSSGE